MDNVSSGKNSFWYVKATNSQQYFRTYEYFSTGFDACNLGLPILITQRRASCLKVVNFYSNVVRSSWLNYGIIKCHRCEDRVCDPKWSDLLMTHLCDETRAPITITITFWYFQSRQTPNERWLIDDRITTLLIVVGIHFSLDFISNNLFNSLTIYFWNQK